MPYTLCKLLGIVTGLLYFSQEVVFYDDDLSSKGEEEHYRLLEDVLARMRGANLAIRPDKLQLANNRYEYLGFEFLNGEWNCTKERRKMTKSIERPKSKKEIQRLLGYINYFIYFLPDMPKLLRPIYGMLKRI